MKFTNIFKNQVMVRYLIFGLVLIVATVGLSFIDSADDVQIFFNSEDIAIKSDGFTMTIPYSIIADLELVDQPDAGTCIDGKDIMVLRTGTWKNDAWGEYSVCADLDCTVCIVAHLDDGRVFVFSRKSNAETQRIYEQLLTYIPSP